MYNSIKMEETRLQKKTNIQTCCKEQSGVHQKEIAELEQFTNNTCLNLTVFDTKRCQYQYGRY